MIHVNKHYERGLMIKIFLFFISYIHFLNLKPTSALREFQLRVYLSGNASLRLWFPLSSPYKLILHSVNVQSGTVAPLFLLAVLNNKDTKAEWSVIVVSRVSPNIGEQTCV